MTKQLQINCFFRLETSINPYNGGTNLSEFGSGITTLIQIQSFIIQLLSMYLFMIILSVLQKVHSFISKIFQTNSSKSLPKDISNMHIDDNPEKVSLMFKSIPNYEQFCEKYALHPLFGFMVDPRHEPTSFRYKILQDLCKKAHKMTQEELDDLMMNFPDLNVAKNIPYEDKIALHDMLIVVMNLYLDKKRKKKIQDSKIILPKSLCLPLYEISKEMDIKPSMVINICTNWLLNNDTYLTNPDKFSLKDFELRWYLSEKPQQEKYFFGASIIGAFYMGKILRHLFVIQKSIEEQKFSEKDIEDGLNYCEKDLQRIIEEVRIMYQKLDPGYFFEELRPLVDGYKGLLFTGILNMGEMRLTMTGGTGGYDPSFQMFESALGIKFQKEYKATQDALLQQGMYWQHKNAIFCWRNCYEENNPNIRNFCKERDILKKKYNQLLKKYKEFMGLHSSLISKFIMKNISKEGQAVAQGTGGTLIKKIIDRYEVIENQFL